MRLTTTLCFVAGLFLLAGCLERTEKLSLNPDGSGKSQMDLSIWMPVNPDPNNSPDLKAMARDLVRAIVNNSRGIDAWKDVKYSVDGDGRVRFAGAAYFKDVEKYDVSRAGSLKLQWSKDAQGGRTLTLSTPELQFVPNPGLTDQVLDALIAQARADWELRRPGTIAAFDNMRCDLTYLLPGKVESRNIFQPASGGVRLVIKGTSLLDATDRWYNDDDALKAAAKAGRPLVHGPDGPTRTQLMFGRKGPVSAQVAGDLKPLFDYETEADAARKAQPEMLKKLGLGNEAAPR